MEEDYSTAYNRLVATPYEELRTAQDPHGAKKGKYFWIDRINYEKSIGFSYVEEVNYIDFMISCIILGKYQYIPYLLTLVESNSYSNWKVDIVAHCYHRAIDKDFDKSDTYARMLINILKHNEAPLRLIAGVSLFDDFLVTVLNSSDRFKQYVLNELLGTTAWKAAVTKVIINRTYKPSKNGAFVASVANNMRTLSDYLGNTESRLAEYMLAIGSEEPKLANTGEQLNLYILVARWLYDWCVKFNSYTNIRKAFLDERFKEAVLEFSYNNIGLSPEMTSALEIRQPDNVRVRKQPRRSKKVTLKVAREPQLLTEDDPMYGYVLGYLKGKPNNLKKNLKDGMKMQIRLLSPKGNRSLFLSTGNIEFMTEPSSELFSKDKDKDNTNIGEYIKLFQPSPIEQIQVVIWDINKPTIRR